ncbi:uncharacterized protein LOC115246262 [Formica exsecta]|uniref:uncharacterized protein LOC115246262 n=1 Tax=Formica exsecta TaxID=72781 RepID=UPI0011441FC7|nr:uncharacterized protein LOC115246262 [Formica exsecta]
MSKKSKPLPEPEPIKLPTSNDNIQNIDKEMSSHSSVLKTAARVATTSQPRANTSLSEGQITKFVITFEDFKYDIGSIKKDIKCIKNKLFSDNVTEKKLPEETETLIPALSLRNLSTFNELLKQKFVFALYVNHFRRLGGTSQADRTRRILRRIVHNELAKKLNWAGRGAKTSLQSFDAVCQLILRSASTNQETSYKITEETIKSWLRYAMDRDGGRNRKKETINNNQTDESQSENYTS